MKKLIACLLTMVPLLATSQTRHSTNLALHRAAWASSSYDYNMTAHLATDGICDDAPPVVLSVGTPDGPLPRREREWAIDGNVWSNHLLTGSHTYLQFSWQGMPPVHATRAVLYARMAHREGAHGYAVSCQASADGGQWTTLGTVSGDTLPGRALRYKVQADPNKQSDDDLLPARVINMEIPLHEVHPSPFTLHEAPSSLHPSPFTLHESHLRLSLEAEGAVYWMVYNLQFFDGDREVFVLPSQQFCSLWMSDGGGLQWLKVDLGSEAEIDSIVPHWLEEPRRWHPEVTDGGRTVTIVMEQPGPSGYYAMRELEVFGVKHTEDESPSPTSLHPSRITLHPSPITLHESPFTLHQSWTLQRASEVGATGEQISTADYDAQGWISATVPGTVLTSYINIGAVPDPNYADNADQISESFFRSNFWYRGVMQMDDQQLTPADGRQLLCFDGINWKANVFFNGERLGRIEGAFQRAQFDVTRLLRQGDNYVAVEIVCNEHFGSVKEKDANTTQFNGGILGADNPTFHASIGWDWITTVRGREAGIWNDVYLKHVPGGIALTDPYVQTVVKENGEEGREPCVAVTPAVYVKNLNDTAVTTTVHGWIGDIEFDRDVTLAAHSEQEVSFSAEDYPQLQRTDFRLWWPNGYGEPYRYEAGFAALALHESRTTNHASRLTYRPGLRQMTYVDQDDSLRIYINGRRFVPLGGNWGFPEHNLQYDRHHYDAAVDYHRDMHCTMIRNWVGQTGHRAFYDACDSLGIMVWQDFWLANPADGPDPQDEPMFLSNASDYVRRIRQHPSIGIYCGRNEGYPPKTIDTALRRYVDRLSPGLAYISSSADDGVTGHGPYCAQPARVYFERQSGKLHTERGMPAVMNMESLRRTFSPDSLWPQSTEWGQHDYTLLGAQRALEFNTLVERDFGPAATAEEFARHAQLINYEGYRAMFESGSRTRSGLLIWMSHPCWPTMVWQTYDYYLDPTAAYFGVKKACEPLHIQLNALTDSVEVVNLFAGDHSHLGATATLYDAFTGRQLWRRTVALDSRDDSRTPVMAVAPGVARKATCPLLRLELCDANAQVLSQNDYFLDPAQGHGRRIASLPAATIEQKQTVSGNTLTLLLSNTGTAVAPLLRLNLVDTGGRQLLPAVYSDNYFNLLPGERRTVTIEWPAWLGPVGQPRVEVTPLP